MLRGYFESKKSLAVKNKALKEENENLRLQITLICKELKRRPSKELWDFFHGEMLRLKKKNAELEEALHWR